MNENEIWIEDQNGILQVFSMEFSKRFRKNPNVNIQDAFSLSKDVSDSENERLPREVTIDEAWRAVQQISPLKKL